MRDAVDAATKLTNEPTLQAAVAAGMLAGGRTAVDMRGALDDAIDASDDVLVQAALVFGDTAVRYESLR
jgi:hypothetical protein